MKYKVSALVLSSLMLTACSSGGGSDPVVSTETEFENPFVVVAEVEPETKPNDSIPTPQKPDVLPEPTSDTPPTSPSKPVDTPEQPEKPNPQSTADTAVPIQVVLPDEPVVLPDPVPEKPTSLPDPEPTPVEQPVEQEQEPVVILIELEPIVDEPIDLFSELSAVLITSNIETWYCNDMLLAFDDELYGRALINNEFIVDFYWELIPNGETIDLYVDAGSESFYYSNVVLESENVFTASTPWDGTFTCDKS